MPVIRYGGPPRAVSPIGEVEKVLRFAVSQIPPHKIMMGINLYGYDWTLPYQPGRWARSVSPQQALEIALTNNAAISYDQKDQAPYFHYYDKDGAEHVVWFEDARSIRARYLLGARLGLRGFSYWVLGNEFPQNWLVLQDMFTVKKL